MKTRTRTRARIYRPASPLGGHLSPSAFGQDHASKHLEAACRLAGVKPPNRAGDLRAMLTAAPVEQVAAAQIADGFDTDDLDQWHAHALDAVREALAAAALTDAMNKTGAQHAVGRYGPDLMAVMPALIDKFNEAKATLEEVAPDLPANDPIGDLEAVMKTHATRQHQAAVEALGVINTIAGAIPRAPVRQNGAIDQAALIVCDVPDVPQPIRIERRGQYSPLDIPDRTATQNYYRAFNEDPDTALVDVARNRYAPVELALVGGKHPPLVELEGRWHRLYTATHTVHVEHAPAEVLAANGIERHSRR